MNYVSLQDNIKLLGFNEIEEFAKYVGVTPIEIEKWKSQNEVPHAIEIIIDLLKNKKPDTNNSLDNLIDECIPLANLLNEATSFRDKLEEMFMLQKELNDSTNGKNWELGLNKFGKEINWLRCIHMELAELVDSTPWKHWKNINAGADIDNIHIELVDIWHFMMSYILQETNIPKGVALVNAHCIYEPLKEIDYKAVIKEAEKLSYISLAIETGNMPAFSGIERSIDQFFRCCKTSGLSFSWLQRLYIGKNCLNKFRQDNGYKEGTYIKEWNGEEDNVVMVRVLNNLDDVTFESLYEKLDEAYKAL